MWLARLSIFSWFYWPSVCLYGIISIQVFCPFFNQVVCFWWTVWVFFFFFNINPLSDILFANIFLLHLVGGLFFLTVSFTVQNNFIVWCSIICLVWGLFHFPGVVYPKNAPNAPKQCQIVSVLPTFYSRTFLISGLTFKSLICDKLIFCVWYKTGTPFYSFACGCPVFPTPFVKETTISPLSTLGVFVKN